MYHAKISEKLRRDAKANELSTKHSGTPNWNAPKIESK